MSTKDVCKDEGLTNAEKWEKLYGTTAYGNLPQNKRTEHVGYIWAPCPYSTQSTEMRTRALLELADSDPLPTKVDHTNAFGKVHYLVKNGKRFECTFADCPFNISNGRHYFYI